MLGRPGIGALLIILLAFPSEAEEKEDRRALRTQQCYAALAVVENQLNKRVEDKTLTERQIDDINLILDEADNYCFKSRLRKGTQKINEAREIITTSVEAKVN